MADAKITALTELTSVTNSDLLAVVDDPGGSPITKKATVGNVMSASGLVLTLPQINDTSSDHQYVFTVSELTANRNVTLPLLTGNDEFTFNDHAQTLTNKTLTSPVLTTPQINDTSADHQYITAVSELTADRTVTLPLLTGNDEFVFKDHTQTLTNKTLDSTSPTAFNFPGLIQMYGGATAPTGWLLCNGAAVSRTTYAALFAVISTTFGVGDNSTTFNVPDFRGIFPKGAGTTDRAAGKDANGNFYASTLGTYSTDKMQGHKHDKPTDKDYVTYGSGGNAAAPTWGGANTVQFGEVKTGEPVTDGTNGTPRVGLTTEPQSLGVTYIIKT